MPKINEVQNDLDEYLSKETICNLYNDEELLNRKGYIDGENIRYTEYIAKQLLFPTNFSLLKNIPSAGRSGEGKEGYNVGHEGANLVPGEKITEERLARSWMNKNIPNLGKIIDYQTPLKPYMKENPDKNRIFGNIDLLAWDGDNLVILEFKRSDTTETLLRCILEAYTYLKTVDQDKLRRDFEYDDTSSVHAAALVYINSQPHKDWQDEEQELPNVKELMEKLGIGLYLLDNDTNLNVIETYLPWK